MGFLSRIKSFGSRVSDVWDSLLNGKSNDIVSQNNAWQQSFSESEVQRAQSNYENEIGIRVADAQRAGINPLAAVGQSDSAQTVASPNLQSPRSSGIVEPLMQILGLALEKQKSDASVKLAHEQLAEQIRENKFDDWMRHRELLFQQEQQVVASALESERNDIQLAAEKAQAEYFKASAENDKLRILNQYRHEIVTEIIDKGKFSLEQQKQLFDVCMQSEEFKLETEKMLIDQKNADMSLIVSIINNGISSLAGMFNFSKSRSESTSNVTSNVTSHSESKSHSWIQYVKDKFKGKE